MSEAVTAAHLLLIDTLQGVTVDQKDLIVELKKRIDELTLKLAAANARDVKAQAYITTIKGKLNVSKPATGSQKKTATPAQVEKTANACTVCTAVVMSTFKGNAATFKCYACRNPSKNTTE
jgi:formamidopyrimidine-DNA glycosylase